VSVDAVLFDVDGTLIDSVGAHARAWTRALHYFGVDVTFDQVHAQIGKGGDQLLPVFMSAADLERRGKALEAYRQEIFKRDELPTIRPLPRVGDLFVRLRRAGRRIVLASSAHGWEIEHHLRLLNVEQLVDGFTTRDDVERSKPYPDIFASALEVAGVPADRAVAVGDSPWDAVAATGAGVRTLGVRSGGFSDADLRAAGCLAIYDDPAALLIDYPRSLLAD
jgi:beta-phosphoglucomutase-like phosphatase (HAD superfamily)